MNTTSTPRGPGRNVRTRRSSDLTPKGASEDRWLLTYSDMITLLLVLFIVLFAISKVDQAKFREFKQSVTEAVLTHTPHGTVPKSPSNQKTLPVAFDGLRRSRRSWRTRCVRKGCWAM